MQKDRSASGDPVGEPRSGAVRWPRRLLLLASKLLCGLSASSLLLSIALLFSFPGRRNPHFARDFELPLSDPIDVVSDKEGRIYVGVGFYNRVQVYDDDGDYLFGFFIDCHGGAFVLEVDGDDRLHVFTARGSMHHIYDRHGNLVKTTKDLPKDVYKRHARSRHRRFDAAGRRYAIRRPLWDPTIERVMPSGRVLLRIRTPFWLFPCIFPVPCFAVCLISSAAQHYAKRRRERDWEADRGRSVVTHSSRERETGEVP